MFGRKKHTHLWTAVAVQDYTTYTKVMYSCSCREIAIKSLDIGGGIPLAFIKGLGPIKGKKP